MSLDRAEQRLRTASALARDTRRLCLRKERSKNIITTETAFICAADFVAQGWCIFSRELLPNVVCSGQMGWHVNSLYYGDNLKVLRDSIASESVDLIYLDPPFNSSANYNVLFKTPSGERSQAQIEAFEDTWHWNELAERAFDEVVTGSHSDAAVMLRAMRSALGENDMMAYLAMMAARLIELHRVLKPSGTIYLHCDPTASHYLKLLMDGIFGVKYFLDEIIWQRTNAHNFKAKAFPRVHDVLLFYAKSDLHTYNQLYSDFSSQQLDRYEAEPDSGRLYTGQDMTIIGGDMAPWRGTTPNGNRGWGLSLSEREKLWKAGLVLKRKDGSPRLDGRKVYLDEKEGVPISDLWTDVKRIANTSGERLGYPTQKPLALLERILNASSREGDLVLIHFAAAGQRFMLHRNSGERGLALM